MFRWFKLMWAKLSGIFIGEGDKLLEDADVQRAEYEEVISAKKRTYSQLKDGVAGLVGRRRSMLDEISRLQADADEMQDEMDGAIVIAQERVSEIGEEAAQDDEEYLEAASAFEDISATLDERKARIDTLMENAEELETRYKDHLIQLQSLQREIEQLKTEKTDAVADIAAAQVMASVNDQITGISDDDATERLNALREARSKMNAKVEVGAKLAGTNVQVKREKFKAAARRKKGNSAFAAAVGLKGTATSDKDNGVGDKITAATDAPRRAGRLPEA